MSKRHEYGRLRFVGKESYRDELGPALGWMVALAGIHVPSL